MDAIILFAPAGGHAAQILISYLTPSSSDTDLWDNLKFSKILYLF